MNMKTLNFLASANTCEGFENHFNSIFPNENSFTYILKGGPGTGKSTFMKKIARIYKDKGFTVECFYCSSDPNSFDGVRIVEKDISIVDGTAPHTTECSIPGAKEVIINLGSAIKSDIKKHLNDIVPLLEKKKECFTLAYSYLEAAGKLLKTSKMQAKGEINEILEAQKTFSLLQITPEKYFGNVRQLYLSYFTSNGLKMVENHFERTVKLPYSLFDGMKVLRELANLASRSGHEVIEILSPICVGELEGVYFPTIDTYVTLDDKALKAIPDGQMIFNLLKKGGKWIEKARSYHLQVEKYYIKNMNFEAIDEYFEKVNEEIYNS